MWQRRKCDPLFFWYEYVCHPGDREDFLASRRWKLRGGRFVQSTIATVVDRSQRGWCPISMMRSFGCTIGLDARSVAFIGWGKLRPGHLVAIMLACGPSLGLTLMLRSFGCRACRRFLGCLCGRRCDGCQVLRSRSQMRSMLGTIRGAFQNSRSQMRSTPVGAVFVVL